MSNDNPSEFEQGAVDVFKKKITQDEWTDFVGKNCSNSYSLVVCLMILQLWEHGVEDKATAHHFITRIAQGSGISGAQADMIISYAGSRTPDGWLDPDMVSVSQTAVTEDTEITP